MGKWLRGIGVPPVLVGLVRGFIEAAAFAGLAYLSAVLPQIDQGEAWQTFVPVILLGIRMLEGLADQIDPAKRRV